MSSDPRERKNGGPPESGETSDEEVATAQGMLGLQEAEQQNQDIISIHHRDVESKKVGFKGEIIIIYTAPPGKLIDPTLEEEGKNQYAKASGDNLYTHFVEMGQVLEKQNMIGKQDMIGMVAEEDRWSEEKTPPENILIDGFDGGVITESIARAAVGIENLDRDYGLSGWLDPVLCEEYAGFEEKIRDIWNETTERADIGVALLRAGGTSLNLAGYDESNTALLQAKRHNMVGNPANIGIGLNIDEETLVKIGQAESIELAERAIASGSSLLALLMVLNNAHVLPDDIRITGIGAAQQGLDFMDKFLKNYFVDTNKKHSIKIARLFYILTGGDHPYYIQALSGFYAVSDGGDYADLLLPPEHRTVWNKPFTAEMIKELKKKTGVVQIELDELEVEIDGIVSIEQAVGLRNICVKNRGIDNRFLVGEILTGFKYKKNTNE